MTQQEKRISISSKIFMIAASFSLPIAVLTYLMVSSINSYIAFGSKEIVGNAYQIALEDLLHHIQAHQVVVYTCPPSAPGCSGRLAQEKAKTDQAFTKLVAVNELHGKVLEFTDEGLKKRNRDHLQVSTVQGEWQALATGIAQGSQPSDTTTNKYNHLVDDIRTMITHSGDTSNLILDPDLDSYYLMDVTLLALPQIQDRLGRILISGAAALKTPGPLTQDARVRLAVDAALLEETDLGRIIASTQTAINEDANFYGVSPSLKNTLEPSLDKLRNTTKNFISLTRQVSSAAQPNTTPEAFAQAGTAAREASFEYWSAAVGELDRLLDVRISSYRRSRAIALSLAGLALLLASAGAFAWMRSIVRPLRNVATSLSQGEALLGKCVERVYDAGQAGFRDKEEIWGICKELNAHALEIRTVASELKQQVQGSSHD